MKAKEVMKVLQISRATLARWLKRWGKQKERW